MYKRQPLGQAYLIPFKNKGVLECQFQLGYKGMLDLAYRSGEVSVIQAHTVYENDMFEYELGLDPKLKQIPAKENRGEPAYLSLIHIYCDTHQPLTGFQRRPGNVRRQNTTRRCQQRTIGGDGFYRGDVCPIGIKLFLA